jgi:putative transposase
MLDVLLVLVDEYRRECLAIDVARRLTSEDVLERLAFLFATRGVPEHIRSDNGAEFTCQAVREWLGKVGVKTLFIEPKSPWENGYAESFIGKLWDELLNGEIFYTLLEAKVLIEHWRRHYNRHRPHSALGYRPPAPEAVAVPALAAACGAGPTLPEASPSHLGWSLIEPASRADPARTLRCRADAHRVRPSSSQASFQDRTMVNDPIASTEARCKASRRR